LLALIESLVVFVGYRAVVKRDPARLKAVLRGLFDGLKNFGRALAHGAPRFGGHEDPRIDLELLGLSTMCRVLASFKIFTELLSWG
jgi:hypothetical protein